MLNGSSSPSPSSSSCAKHRRLIQAPHPGHRSKGNSSCQFFGIRRIRNYDFKIFCSVSLSTGSIRKPRGLLDPQYDLSAKWAGIWSSDPPWWIINGYSNLAIEFIPSVQVRTTVVQNGTCLDAHNLPIFCFHRGRCSIRFCQQQQQQNCQRRHFLLVWIFIRATSEFLYVESKVICQL